MKNKNTNGLYYSWIFFALFFLPLVGFSQNSPLLFTKILLLSDQDTLQIKEYDEYSAGIELRNEYGFETRIYLPGFSTQNSMIFYPVALSPDCLDAAVVIMYNRSSNYGARRAWVIWNDKRIMFNSWTIAAAPAETAILKDSDNDGFYEIHDEFINGTSFRFDQGKFINNH